jgi:hypothetical protein
MRSFMKWAVVLIVPAVWVVAARPAEPPVPEGTVVKLLLLRQKSVQKELELTPETAEKINTFTTGQSAKAAKTVGQGEAERKQVFAQLLRENEQFLTETLAPKQKKRLDQITMQFAALTVLTKPEVAKDLNLTDDQTQKLKDLQKDSRKALVDLLSNKEGRTEKFAKLRDETRTKILAILTDDQKTKVRELAGPPFEGEIVFEEPDSDKDK